MSRCPAGSHIGDRVAQLRRKRHVSQRALAAALSISHPTVVKLEKYAQGRLSTLTRVLSFLGAKPKLICKNQKQNFMQVANSSVSDEWYSPVSLLAKLTDAMGAGFDLDPCSPTLNPGQAPVAAARYYTAQQDGLSMKWQGRVYMNPPYSEVKRWVEKARLSVENGDTPFVVGLLPARTDTKWWNGNVAGYAEVFFLQGRLTYLGHHHPAPFPNAIVVWGNIPSLVDRLKASLKAFHMPANL